MKKLKKLLSIVLAVAMVLSLVVVTNADEPTYTITIKDDTANYTYTAYQIFDGDYDSASGVLSNITWGTAITSDTDTLKALYKELAGICDETNSKYPFTDASGDALTSADAVASALSAYSDNDDVVKAFAEVVAKSTYLTGTGTDSSWDNTYSNYTIGLTDAGYYLVKNTTVPAGTATSATGAYTSYILTVVKDVTVSAKSSVPEMTKNVMEKNDSADATTGWQDTADYDVGDSVPFRLTGTVSSEISDYKSYKYTFHDAMSTGLELDTTVDVVVTIYPNYTVDGTTGVVTPSNTGVVVAAGYNVVTSGLTDGCSFEVQFADLLSCKDSNNDPISITATSLVVVEFNAKLTSSAVVGNNGNPNTARLEYANNPYDEDETGTTPWDTNVVFTYEVDVNKVKSDGSVLTGAEFTLYKKVKYSDGDTGTFYSWDSTEGKYVEETSLVDGSTYCIEIGVLTGSGTNSNEYSWSGLDAGDYVLVETETPSGYNTMENVEFTIVATIDSSATHGAATVDNTGVNNYSNEYLTDLSANVTAGTATFTGDKDKGTLTSNIINNAGSELPSTGGIGTTIFYVVGGVLVLGAVVLLITRKRLGSED